MADTFNQLRIEQMTREWFDGPNPTVDGYLSCLRARLNRELPSIDEAVLEKTIKLNGDIRRLRQGP